MFYVFHGNDSHSQAATLATLKKRLGDPTTLDLNTTKLSGNVTLANLQQACNVIPFLAKARLVLVYDLFQSKPDKKYLKQLAAFLPNLPETTRLVFLESEPLPDTHPVVKAARELENGYVKLFMRPEGNALERWIQETVEIKNGRIAPRAAHLLATQVGNNLQVLENEIEKLVLYKGEEAFQDDATVITAEDVTLLCPYAAEASIFDLVDALGNRYGKRAAQLLQEKFQDGSDPFFLFSMIVRQFRLLIQVKEVAEKGERPPAIAKTLKIHPFVANKLYQQSHHFSLSQLEQIYRHLLSVDIGVKTGKNDMTTALYLLVANLTAE